MKINKLRHKFSSTFIFLLIVCNLGYSQENFWNPANGPFGGTIHALSIDESGNIFAGTIGKGIFRSSDNGANWIEINAGLTSNNVETIDINSSGDIFAGTTFNGIFRSTNNGDNWIPINNGLTNSSIEALDINSSGDIFAGSFGGGVYRSTDNGGNWTQINNGLINSNIVSIVINSNNDIFAGSFGDGIFLSTDNGNNWSPVNNGLPSTTINTIIINDNGDILAGTSSDGIYLSSNNGTNWNAANTGIPSTSINAFTINNSEIIAGTNDGIYISSNTGSSWAPINNGLHSTNVNALTINSNNDIFAGTFGGGIFLSVNNGIDWSTVNNGLSALNVHDIATNSGGDIFTGTSGGIFLSTDNGDNWLPSNNGLPNTIVKAITFNSAGDIFAGTFGEGVFISIDNGLNWDAANNGLTSTFINALEVNLNDDIFAGTFNGVFRSSNNGDNWASSGLPTNSVNAFGFNSDGDIFAGTDGGVFFSSDNGENWDFSGLSDKNINTFAVNNDNDIFAGGDGMFLTIDNGENWNSTGLSNIIIEDVIFDELDVFAGTFGNGVFKSNDNGSTWNPNNSGLTNLTVNTLAIGQNSFIFAGTTSGVFFGGGTPPPAADIEIISMAVTNTIPEPGENIKYRIKVKNNGQVSPATNVKIENKLPEGVTYVSHEVFNVNSTYSSETGIWSIPILSNEDIAELEITVTVSPSPGQPMGTGTFISNFVPEGSGGLSNPTDIVFGPDHNGDGVKDLYISSSSNDNILVYNGQSGESLGTFVSAGSGGLKIANGLIFGPDRNGDGIEELYVSSTNNSKILLFNGKTGESLGDFVTESSGGLSAPADLVFGPDQNGDGVGELYVSNLADHKVLYYDGTNGDPLGTFVEAGSQGLETIGDINFGPDRNNDGIPELYISNSSSGKILVYGGRTGGPLGTFADINIGGFVIGNSLIFGPDSDGDGIEELYVTALNKHEVLRFNGKFGTFIDKFVSPIFGGRLKFPDGLTFGPDGNLYVIGAVNDGINVYDGFPTFTATVAADQPDPNPSNDFGSVSFTPRRKKMVTNTNNSGSGSLSDAIEQANNDSDDGNEIARLNKLNNISELPDRIPIEIRIDIPGEGPHTISLSEALPGLTGSWITIDAKDQDGKPNIILDGSNTENGTNGLVISGGNNHIRGLIINNFDGNGIVLQENGKNVIENSIIGTDLQGITNLGNSGAGVYINNSTMNIIGEAFTSYGNTIAYNSTGLIIASGDQNLIRRNSIYSNINQGIDLGEDGVSSNDDDDSDDGPNNLQNYPEIGDAYAIGNDLEIIYEVNSAITYSAYPIFVEFFKADPEGDEGEIFLGSDTLQAVNAQSEKIVRFTSPFKIEIGNRIVGTATDSTGNSSEFSHAFEIITSIKKNESENSYTKFSLQQNYPNPFNPSTIINYSIIKQTNVTLKVYDILGSEIATLVNKKQLPGLYEIEFNGSKLPSEIYFYRLIAGDFIDTKKMILLK